MSGSYSRRAVILLTPPGAGCQGVPSVTGFFSEEPAVVGLGEPFVIGEPSGHSHLIALTTRFHQTTIYGVADCLSSPWYCQFPEEQGSFCFVPRCVPQWLASYLAQGRSSRKTCWVGEGVGGWEMKEKTWSLGWKQDSLLWAVWTGSGLAFVPPRRTKDRVERNHKAETFELQLGCAGYIIHEMRLPLKSTLSGIVHLY